MSTVRIATNFNIEVEFIAPPFPRRLLSWILDMLVQIFYLIIASRFYEYLSKSLPVSQDSLADIHWLGLIFLVPFFVYHLVLEVTMKGQSIGKKIMGIRVISENGSKPSLGQYVIRWLIRTSDYFLFIIILLMPYAEYYGPQLLWGFAGGILLLVADVVLVNLRKQQRLGDILARTVLINTRQDGNIYETIFEAVSEKYTPSFPEVMQLSDRDINSLKSILETARRKHDYRLAEMASDKIKNHLKINTPLSPFDFLEVLLKDYNYLSTH